VLTALVRGEELHDQMRPVAERLVMREVLEPIDDTYRFQVPLLRGWVEQRVGISSRVDRG